LGKTEKIVSTNIAEGLGVCPRIGFLGKRAFSDRLLGEEWVKEADF
jgi:hypothetical protein